MTLEQDSQLLLFGLSKTMTVIEVDALRVPIFFLCSHLIKEKSRIFMYSSCSRKTLLIIHVAVIQQILARAYVDGQ